MTCYALQGFSERNIQPYHFSIKTGYHFASACINSGKDDRDQWNLVEFSDQ